MAFNSVARSTVSDKVLVQPRRYRSSPEGKAEFRGEVGKAPKGEVSSEHFLCIWARRWLPGFPASVVWCLALRDGPFGLSAPAYTGPRGLSIGPVTLRNISYGEGGALKAKLSLLLGNSVLSTLEKLL